MNTIERIESRRSQPSCHDQTEWYRITTDEWAAIKAVIEAATNCNGVVGWKIADNSRISDLRAALAKLQSEN